MDVRQFVAATLEQIMQGVRDAQRSQGGHSDGSAINPIISTTATAICGKLLTHSGSMVEEVDFDIAVTVERSAEKADGELSVFEPSGDQARGSINSSERSANRIRFSIPIGLPAP